MTMYSIEQIKRLQTNEEFLTSEMERYCLVSIIGKQLTKKDVENQANFCILQTIDALKEELLTPYEANNIINKIDAFEYAEDMLGAKRVIEKLNKEIIEDELKIPYFNSLCVVCDDIYDSYQ